MASKEEKIKKLEDDINKMEKALKTFRKLFNEDGNIDAKEQAQLDNISSMIQKIRAKITSLKEEKKQNGNTELIPKDFRLEFNKLQQLTKAIAVYLAQAESDEKVNSKRCDKMIKSAEIVIYKLRKLYGKTSGSVFEKCKALVEKQETKISALKQKASGLNAKIGAAKKSEVKLDGKMKALLKEHNSCPRTLYKHLKETIQKVESNFQQFITANS